jgi:hypothetical protein
MCTNQRQQSSEGKLLDPGSCGDDPGRRREDHIRLWMHPLPLLTPHLCAKPHLYLGLALPIPFLFLSSSSPPLDIDAVIHFVAASFLRSLFSPTTTASLFQRALVTLNSAPTKKRK